MVLTTLGTDVEVSFLEAEMLLLKKAREENDKGAWAILSLPEDSEVRSLDSMGTEN